MNRGKIRQPGTVTQRYVRLHLIVGRKHAEHCMTVCGDLARDRESLCGRPGRAARHGAGTLPDDPHLDYATDVHSSRVVRSDPLPAPEGIIATVLDAAKGLDLVGIYAAGPVYRGFANSLGQRNWHEVTSFNLQWSLYQRADKAVKTAYGGFDWSDQALRRENARRPRTSGAACGSGSLAGAGQLSRLPDADGDGGDRRHALLGRFLRTRARDAAELPVPDAGRRGGARSPRCRSAENTADGIAPAFQDEGFARPASVPLVDERTAGRLAGQPADREGVRSSPPTAPMRRRARNRWTWRAASLAATMRWRRSTPGSTSAICGT